MYVVFAGSWHSRGHSSSLGLGIVIDAHAGLVVDYEVLSKRCQVCAIMRTKIKNKKTTQAKYDAWKHKHDRVCNLNYEGSSGGMEEAAAKTLWARSHLNKLRYKKYIGDGDCSAYNAVCALNDNAGPYGVDKQVIKEECVNHVHKRMGTALRKIVKETTEEYQTKKGEVRQKKLLGGRGKLTDAVIDKLTDYYGTAIRRNVGKTVEAMSKDIWSTYYHCSSTDEYPMHFYCPEGEKSWCFWKWALFQKKKEEEEKQKRQEEREEELGEASQETVSFYGQKKPPAKKQSAMPSHKTMKVHFAVGDQEKRRVRAVYERLTNEDLLKRCLQGKTQNPNESLHARVWKLCPKVKSLGKATLDFSIAQATINYNIGYEAGFLGNELGITNHRSLKLLREMDLERERMRRSKPRKKRRKIEADPQYAPGEY